MIAHNEGTVFLFQPESETESEWLQEKTNAEDWQWLGRDLAVDHRFAIPLIDAMEADDIKVNLR